MSQKSREKMSGQNNPTVQPSWMMWPDCSLSNNIPFISRADDSLEPNPEVFFELVKDEQMSRLKAVGELKDVQGLLNSFQSYASGGP